MHRGHGSRAGSLLEDPASTLESGLDGHFATVGVDQLAGGSVSPGLQALIPVREPLDLAGQSVDPGLGGVPVSPGLLEVVEGLGPCPSRGQEHEDDGESGCLAHGVSRASRPCLYPEHRHEPDRP